MVGAIMVSQNPSRESIEMETISLKPLTELFEPEILQFRDEEIAEINTVFVKGSHSKYKDYGDDTKCLLLQGFSGSGKSQCVKKVLKDHPGKYFFVSGESNPTAHSLLKSIFDLHSNTLSSTIEKAIEILSEDNKVLVIDEINKLKNIEEIRLLFNALNTIYRRIPYSMILITNKKGFLNFIPQDGRLTFHPEQIDFKSYTIPQIASILTSRVESIQKNSPHFNLGQLIIMRISKFVVEQFDGSIRSALILLKKAILNNDCSGVFLQKTIKKMLADEEIDELKNLSKYHLEFLRVLYNLADFETEMKFQEILEKTSYSPGRVTQLLDYFEKYHGILKSKNINRGRAGGNVRIVSFASIQKYKTVGNALYDGRTF